MANDTFNISPAELDRIFSDHGRLTSTAAASSIDWGSVTSRRDSILGEPYTTNTRPTAGSSTRVPQMTPVDLSSVKAELLVKLLEIEGVRCKSKVSEDERTESLAQLLEAEDHVLQRISKGMERYLGLIQQPMSIMAVPAPSSRNTLTDEEMRVWEQIQTEVRARTGQGLSRFSLMHFAVNTSSPRPLETQITLTFSDRR